MLDTCYPVYNVLTHIFRKVTVRQYALKHDKDKFSQLGAHFLLNYELLPNYQYISIHIFPLTPQSSQGLSLHSKVHSYFGQCLSLQLQYFSL